VLLGRYVSVEPLVAYRTEALDVYRTAELRTILRSVLGHIPEKSKGFTLSVCRREVERERGGWVISGWQTLRRTYLVEAHRPALKDLLPPGELCDKRKQRKSGHGTEISGKECGKGEGGERRR